MPFQRHLPVFIPSFPRYWRRVSADRWIVRGTVYALERLPSGTFQFFSAGKPAFTVATLRDADQALADLLDAGTCT